MLHFGAVPFFNRFNDFYDAHFLHALSNSNHFYYEEHILTSISKLKNLKWNKWNDIPNKVGVHVSFDNFTELSHSYDT